jgi:uncharacterized protein YfaP (DUF2135 family)
MRRLLAVPLLPSLLLSLVAAAAAKTPPATIPLTISGPDPAAQKAARVSAADVYPRSVLVTPEQRPQGYGPEEYCLRRAMPGVYTIETNDYGSRSQKLMGPVTVQATVITHFGRPDEHRESLTLRLADQKETVQIGKVTIK